MQLNGLITNLILEAIGKLLSPDAHLPAYFSPCGMGRVNEHLLFRG